MLVLNVFYTMVPGKREEFLAMASEVREEVRRENGCIQYDYFCPVETGEAVLLLEKWTDEQAQKVHLEQPHMKKLAQAKEGRVLETRVERYVV